MSIIDVVLGVIDQKRKWGIMELNTIVNDIYDIDENNIEVDLEVYINGNYETSYLIKIDLRNLGLTNDMDYEFQLSKDLNRIVERLYKKQNKIPSLRDIEKEVNDINYLIIDTRGLK